ncbi:hypothetical protein [Sphingopyxis sp. LC81]|uniref:hypothetical protein n=1 Tax=Sphingopyxis sp. LC81 TaxID=1502850 RepID=UPI00126A6CEA|nr:hypothetical protein [Sphingopyxis sp. LC81]
MPTAARSIPPDAGQGHHGNDNIATRDTVKRNAPLGHRYVEVVSGETPAEVRATVRKRVGGECGLTRFY